MRKLVVGLLAALSVGCTTIDYDKGAPPDFPTLTVVDMYGSEAFVEMNKYVDCKAPWFMMVLACMIPDYDRMLCRLFFPLSNNREGVPNWIWDHEMMHCKGYDHPDPDRELWNGWADWKKRNGR